VERGERWSGALGLALVFATSLFARAFQGGAAFQGYFAFKLSVVMGVLALYLVLCAAREPPKAPPVTS